MEIKEDIFMKTHRFDRNSWQRQTHRPHIRKFNRRGRKQQGAFKEIVKSYLHETPDEQELYPVNLPRHGRFWDNGYEDVG
jgi:hypothetical protein